MTMMGYTAVGNFATKNMQISLIILDSYNKTPIYNRLRQ